MSRGALFIAYCTIRGDESLGDDADILNENGNSVFAVLELEKWAQFERCLLYSLRSLHSCIVAVVTVVGRD